jgi:hypothetical protein
MTSNMGRFVSYRVQSYRLANAETAPCKSRAFTCPRALLSSDRLATLAVARDGRSSSISRVGLWPAIDLRVVKEVFPVSSTWTEVNSS